jgi:hypothetical protein
MILAWSILETIREQVPTNRSCALVAGVVNSAKRVLSGVVTCAWSSSRSMVMLVAGKWKCCIVLNFPASRMFRWDSQGAKILINQAFIPRTLLHCPLNLDDGDRVRGQEEQKWIFDCVPGVERFTGLQSKLFH